MLCREPNYRKGNNMSRKLPGFIEGLKVGERQAHSSLTVFPIYSEAHTGPDYLLLCDALQEKLIEVTEIITSEEYAVLRKRIIDAASPTDL